MTAVHFKFGHPGRSISHTANTALTGGQVVEAVTSTYGKRGVQPAGAGSAKVKGVVKDDIPAAASFIGQPIVGEELNATVVGMVSAPVTFAAAANQGDRLIAAAGGQVTPAGAAPDARQVIGFALEDVASGAVGQAWIF